MFFLSEFAHKKVYCFSWCDIMTFISADCIGALWIWELGNPNPNKIPPPIHHGLVENDLFARKGHEVLGGMLSPW